MRTALFTLADMQAIALRLGGECVSEVYASKNMRWKCGHCGTTWDSAPSNIRHGHWCPKCAGVMPKTITEARQHAAKHGGACLSNEVRNTKSKLWWKCADGHTWKATFKSVLYGSWCPRCKRLIKEEMCRYAIKSLSGLSFTKTRSVLPSKLELDGYNQEKNLAFEYQGEYHYHSIHDSHHDPLKNRVRRDNLKKRECEGLGIVLFEIPFLIANTKETLVEFIKSKLTTAGIPIVAEVDWDNFLVFKSQIKILGQIAEDKGGALLSPSYLGAKAKHTWRCQNGHVWQATPADIKSGTWCKACVGLTKDNIRHMQEIAKTRNGQCVSPIYVNDRTKLEWRCEQGHIWQASPGKIKQGRWCPACAGKSKLTMAAMQILAKEKGGKCLSKVNSTGHAYFVWECSRGHQWTARASHVKSGSWCPLCDKYHSKMAAYLTKNG
jgi:hypothetical protein